MLLCHTDVLLMRCHVFGECIILSIILHLGASHIVIFVQEPFCGTTDDYCLPHGRARHRKLGKRNLTQPLQDCWVSMDALSAGDAR